MNLVKPIKNIPLIDLVNQVVFEDTLLQNEPLYGDGIDPLEKAITYDKLRDEIHKHGFEEFEFYYLPLETIPKVLWDVGMDIEFDETDLEYNSSEKSANVSLYVYCDLY